MPCFLVKLIKLFFFVIVSINVLIDKSLFLIKNKMTGLFYNLDLFLSDAFRT